MNTINKILVVLCLLISLSVQSKAQVPDEIFNGYYRFKGKTQVERIVFDLTDTTSAERLIGNTIYWRHNGVDTAHWQFTGTKWEKMSGGTGGSGGSTSFVIRDTVVLDGSQLDIVIPHGLGVVPTLVDVVVNDPLGNSFNVIKDVTNVTIHYPIGTIGAYIYIITITL